MTYEEAITYIHSFRTFGSRPGLDRINQLLDLMGNPQNQLEYIHVAGTNGKGSTTAMCANILKESGYKTGMFISPYILDFRERFQINGEMISKQDVVSLVEYVKPLIDALNRQHVIVTEFECITAMMFRYFVEQHCDIVCLEVGLGGAIDSTNVIPTPKVSVLTPIGIDHVAYLGDTIEEIAAVKAGIIKKGGVTVSNPKQEPPVLEILMRKCALESNTFVFPAIGTLEILDTGTGGTRFRYDGEEFTVPLIGEHQVYNAITAITAAQNCKGFSVSVECIRRGLQNVRFPARFECVSKNPFVFIDGTHNVHGAQATAEVLRQFDIPKTLVMGMLADKDVDTVVQLLTKRVDRVVCTTVDIDRTMPAVELAKIAGRYVSEMYTEPDNQKAYELALQLTPENGMLLVIGSLYLASDIRKIIIT